jgi:hypothetical protein
MKISIQEQCNLNPFCKLKSTFGVSTGLSTLSKVGGYFEKVGGERRAKRG